MHDFKTADAAKSFASWGKLKKVTQKAWVKGPPQIWVVVEADK